MSALHGRTVGIKDGGGAIDRRVDGAEMLVAHPAFWKRFGLGLVVFASLSLSSSRGLSGRSIAQIIAPAMSAIAAIITKKAGSLHLVPLGAKPTLQEAAAQEIGQENSPPSSGRQGASGATLE